MLNVNALLVKGRGVRFRRQNLDRLSRFLRFVRMLLHCTVRVVVPWNANDGIKDEQTDNNKILFILLSSIVDDVGTEYPGSRVGRPHPLFCPPDDLQKSERANQPLAKESIDLTPLHRRVDTKKVPDPK
jgi:hypothetical protein